MINKIIVPKNTLNFYPECTSLVEHSNLRPSRVKLKRDARSGLKYHPCKLSSCFIDFVSSACMVHRNNTNPLSIKIIIHYIMPKGFGKIKSSAGFTLLH